MARVDAAGIAMVYENKVLILDPHGYYNEMWSIPKGKMDSGESVAVSAARETKEEVGIAISPENLEDHFTVRYTSRPKVLHFFIYPISDLSEIGLDSEEVPKDRLDIREAKAAIFLPFDEAEQRLAKSIKQIIPIIKKEVANERESGR